MNLPYSKSAANDPLVLLLALLVLFGTWGAANYAGSMPGIDFYTAWSAAESVQRYDDYRIYDGAGEYVLGRRYRLEGTQEYQGTRRAVAASEVGSLHATGTPFFYALVGLASSGDYDKDLARWSGLSLGGFLLFFLLMGRLLRLSSALTLLLLLASLVWMDAVRSDLRVANVNMLQLGVLGTSMWLLSRDSKTYFSFGAGLLICLLVLFKPNLAPVAVLVGAAWLLRSAMNTRLAGIAGAMLGLVLAYALSAWYFKDTGIWTAWLSDLLKLISVDKDITGGNIAAANELGSGLGSKARMVVMLAWCGLGVLALWWGRRRSLRAGAQPSQMQEYALLLALGCIIQMTISPLVWLHYYVLLLPMLLVSFRPWEQAEQRGWASVVFLRWLPALVFILLLDSPLMILLGMEYVDYLKMTTTVAISSLLLLGFWQLGYGTREEPVSG